MNLLFELERNHSKMFLGEVVSVSRKEAPATNPNTSKEMRPYEIIFNSPGLIDEGLATPLRFNNEVNVGDPVMIYGMESIYNTTFFYLPIRDFTTDQTVKLKYGNTWIELVPKDEDHTDIEIKVGEDIQLEFSSENKSLTANIDGPISINSTNSISVTTNSDVSINSGDGKVKITNSNGNSAYDLLKSLHDYVTKTMIIATPTGPSSPGTTIPPPTWLEELGGLLK